MHYFEHTSVVCLVLNLDFFDLFSETTEQNFDETWQEVICADDASKVNVAPIGNITISS